MSTSERRNVITLADVARRAGVSKATASKALLDRYDVSAATRARVLQVAEELRFSPNLLARGLGGGRTQTIGMITTDLDGRFAPQIMAGLEDTLGADSSMVIMCNSRGRADLEAHHLRDLLRRSVDGLVMVGDLPEPRAPIAVPSPVPVVYAFASSNDPRDTSVVCDNVQAGRLATEHLLSLGKHDLAYIGGNQRELAATERADGFSTAVSGSGLRPVTGAPLFGDWHEQWGWDAVSQLLQEGIGVDGLVCGDDRIARGAIDRLLHDGIRLGEDIAVIGFDNWLVMSHYSRHPFSSVDLNLREVGSTTAQALISAGGLEPGIRRIVGHVVAR